MTDKVRLMGGGARPGALSSLTAGLAVALVVVTALCGCRDTDGPKSQGAYDWRTLYDEWEEPAPLPHFELVDQAGAEFSLARYEDAIRLFSDMAQWGVEPNGRQSSTMGKLRFPCCGSRQMR